MQNHPVGRLRLKKLMLSALTVVAFVAYAIFQRGAPGPTTTGGSKNSTTNTAGRNAPASSPAAGTAPYKDGTYTGSVANTQWGAVQVQVQVQSSKITNALVIQYPQERRRSATINQTAVPQLQQEAVQAQSANVKVITGATVTTEGFIQSLKNALSQAGG